MEKSSITSLMSAFGRAYHAENANALIFDDKKARELMTDEEYSIITNYILGGIDFFAPDKKDSFADSKEALQYLVNTQISPTPLARAAFCENALKTSMRTGTEQYVILGAGMDTFAFREPEFLERYDVFELDHPLTQEDKRERIKRAGWVVPPKLHFVPIDFTKIAWSRAIIMATAPSIFFVDFSLSGFMFLAGSRLMKILSIIHRR